MTESMSPLRRLAYAFGSPGFQASERTVVLILFYFYLPPGSSDLPLLLSDTILFGGLTAFGAAMFVGRIFDSLADPFVGLVSDRSTSRLGRRKIFMISGFVPMCLIPVAAFWPPGEPGSQLNFIWLTACLAGYFIFFTVYVAPYLALQPELARSQDERARLAVLTGSLTMPFVSLVAFAWPWALSWGIAHGYSSTQSIRTIVVALAVAGLVLCGVAILSVDEKRFTRATRSTLSNKDALRETVRNRPFLIYLLAQIFFMFALNMIMPLSPYIAEVLLGRDVGFASWLGLCLFLGVIVSFVVLFGVALSMLALIVPDVPGGEHDTRNVVIAFASLALGGIPVAGFLVATNVLLGQIIDADQATTGANRAAIFFGIQGLATKWVYGFAAAVLAYLFTQYGNSPEEPLGVWLAAPCAAVCCLVSAALYALYPERDVLARAQSAAPSTPPLH
jgi:GPH family glycoside/pentoside/hexuronide:cation symporter